mmetsp:Transcript_32614/g.104406  ORF Transcript_32614/g.104406 Transcript_32614/m.104406 type:complete len:276 (+) Transcript_32614:102-929(+)
MQLASFRRAAHLHQRLPRAAEPSARPCLVQQRRQLLPHPLRQRPAAREVEVDPRGRQVLPDTLNRRRRSLRAAVLVHLLRQEGRDRADREEQRFQRSVQHRLHCPARVAVRVAAVQPVLGRVKVLGREALRRECEGRPNHAVQLACGVAFAHEGGVLGEQVEHVPVGEPHPLHRQRVRLRVEVGKVAQAKAARVAQPPVHLSRPLKHRIAQRDVARPVGGRHPQPQHVHAARRARRRFLPGLPVLLFALVPATAAATIAAAVAAAAAAGRRGIRC